MAINSVALPRVQPALLAEILESGICQECGIGWDGPGILKMPARNLGHFREWCIARRDYLDHLRASNSDAPRPGRLVGYFDRLIEAVS